MRSVVRTSSQLLEWEGEIQERRARRIHLVWQIEPTGSSGDAEKYLEGELSIICESTSVSHHSLITFSALPCPLPLHNPPPARPAECFWWTCGLFMR
jgi:hypothetical protein